MCVAMVELNLAVMDIAVPLCFFSSIFFFPSSSCYATTMLTRPVGCQVPWLREHLHGVQPRPDCCSLRQLLPGLVPAHWRKGPSYRRFVFFVLVSFLFELYFHVLSLLALLLFVHGNDVLYLYLLFYNCYSPWVDGVGCVFSVLHNVLQLLLS